MVDTVPPQTFWASHGTKVLGYAVAIVGMLAAGSVALPPPLDAWSTPIKSWAVFLTSILGVLVAGRGYGNTAAIAAEVVKQTPAPPAAIIVQPVPVQPRPVAPPIQPVQPPTVKP
jgi:hypothetical protein